MKPNLPIEFKETKKDEDHGLADPQETSTHATIAPSK